MTVTSQTSRVSYAGDGTTTTFPVPFYFIDAVDLTVIRRTAAGVEATLILNSTYSVSGAGDEAGGSVTMTTAPAAGDTLIIFRDPPLTQTADYTPNGRFPAESHERALDRLVMSAQRTRELVMRTFRLSDGAPQSSLTIPTPEAGKLVQWKEDLTGLENVENHTVAPGAYAVATQSEAEGGTRNDVLTTPLRVRQAIQVGQMHIAAWDYGVPGDGSEQGAALEAILEDQLPSGGGIIHTRGIIDISDLGSTGLALTARPNVHILGQGRVYGTGGNTQIRSTLDGDGDMINAAGAVGCNFRDLAIVALGTAFSGTVINFGGPTPTAEAAYNRIENCALAVSGSTSTSVKLVWLYGITVSTIENSSLSWGNGAAVYMQNNAATNVGWSNNIGILGNNFSPNGNGVPIQGSGEMVRVIGNNFQAGVDGLSRILQSSNNRPFKGLLFTGNSAYDATTGGVEAIIIPWGYGINIDGNMFNNVTGSYNINLGGGGTGGDPGTKGVQGASIMGNYFSGGTAMIALTGTAADSTNARGVVIGGNTVINGALMGTMTEARQLVILPNNIYGATTEIGTHMYLQGLPEYADRAAAVTAGYTTGQAFIATGTSDHRVLEIV